MGWVMVVVYDKKFQLAPILTGNASELYRVWKQYWELSVWRNEDICDSAFLFLNGAYLTKNGTRLRYHGRDNNPRLHVFVIRESGTGKSEASKSTNEFAKGLGLDSSHLLKATDAALTGSILDTPKGAKEIPGLLAIKNCLMWDEGSVFLKQNPHSETLQDIIQQTTDEPGIIERSLRLGTNSFESRTSVWAHSYMTESVNATIFGKGLFQRMLLSYREVGSNEIADFCRNRYRLVGSDPEVRSECVERYGAILASAEADQGRTITFDEQAVKSVGEKVANLVDEYGRAFKSGDCRNRILASFISRNNQILHIAGIIAALNGSQTAGEAEMEVGFGMWRNHLDSANAVLALQRAALPDAAARRLDVLRQTLSQNPGGMAKLRLVDALMNSGGWDMRDKNTRDFINEQIEKGVLKEERGKGNTQTVSLA